VLELFITVSLYPLKEGSQSHLLLAAEFGLFLIDDLVDGILIVVSLRLLLDVTLDIELFCLFIPLGMHKFLNFLAHFHELFGEGDLN
jgi:hypothetical protein